MPKLPPVHDLKKWIEDNKDKLKPPVCNEVVWRGDKDFIVMVIGGPNIRTDYHIDPYAEFFFQVKGDMILKIKENGQDQDIPIKEGEMFLLPAYVPHSPQRFKDTVGMVIEQVRKDGDIDHLRWYCEKCGEVLYDTEFKLEDIVNQLKVIFGKFFGSEKLRTCKKCGTVHPNPNKK